MITGPKHVRLPCSPFQAATLMVPKTTSFFVSSSKGYTTSSLYAASFPFTGVLIDGIAAGRSRLSFGGMNFLSFARMHGNSIIVWGILYAIVANYIYLARRAHIRKSGGMTIQKLLKIRLEREPQVSWLWYGIYIVAWQIFALGIFPWLEPIMFILFKHVSFYYSYPNANGFGFIVEPLHAQELPLRKRQKTQKRLDWHKFTINVGPMDKYGYRHPPKKTLHVPHVDAPQYGLKHWPWDSNSMQQRKDRL